jgi:large subunit ribosomal protein L18
MKQLIVKAKRKERRKLRIRSIVSGTAERPRISVFKSNKHLYVQVIDDVKGHTLLSVANIGENAKLKANIPGAEALGITLGNSMKDAQLVEAVFDRNGNLYHGVVKALADGIRKAGIKF